MTRSTPYIRFLSDRNPAVIRRVTELPDRYHPSCCTHGPPMDDRRRGVAPEPEIHGSIAPVPGAGSDSDIGIGRPQMCQIKAYRTHPGVMQVLLHGLWIRKIGRYR